MNLRTSCAKNGLDEPLSSHFQEAVTSTKSLHLIYRGFKQTGSDVILA